MRIDQRKRLGALGAVLLLTLTLLGAAFASAASAQVVTATFGVKVTVDNGTGGTADKTSFAVTIDGDPTPHSYPATGVLIFNLDSATTHSAAAVDFPGFTATLDAANCTDVTLTPGTPIVCNILEKFIDPITTTTTTTTLPPIPTTQPPVGRTTAHGSASDPNKCSSHLEPTLQKDGTPTIVVGVSADAAPQPHFGDPITLSKTKIFLTIPASLLQAGVDVNLIHNNDKVPSVVTFVISGSNTVEQTHTYTISQTATIVVIGKKAQPLHATLPLPDTSWTPVNGTSDVLFAEKSLKIVSKIALQSTGITVTATFACSPTTGTPFVALGATQAIVQPTTPPTTAGGGGTTSGTTAGLALPPGAQQLPRTGSSPWPLFVVGAVCVDLGMLAIAAAKRRRRPLHH